MYISRYLRQTEKATHDAFKKLDYSKQFFTQDVAKTHDNRILGINTRWAEYVKEYEKLSQPENPYTIAANTREGEETVFNHDTTTLTNLETPELMLTPQYGLSKSQIAQRELLIKKYDTMDAVFKEHNRLV